VFVQESPHLQKGLNVIFSEDSHSKSVDEPNGGDRDSDIEVDDVHVDKDLNLSSHQVSEAWHRMVLSINHVQKDA
jgi:hypothetical protein